jgi:Tol biopolymer transport system component
MRLFLRLLPLAVCAAALLPVGAGAAGTERVSVTNSEGEPDGHSNFSDISWDARFVVFESTASNLNPDDAEALLDVFLRDRNLGTTELISRASGAGANGNNTSFRPSVNADGRFVAFNSSAINLHTDDVDVTLDIYVRDRFGVDATLLASRATGGGGAKGNGASAEPDINQFGNRVGFQSAASNLDPADADTALDIFLRDLQTQTTEYISRATGVAGAASDGANEDASVNSFGDLVAFESTGTNMHPDDTDAAKDVYVRDTVFDTTTLVSRASGVSGAKGNGASVNPAISADGRFVAFQSNATNLHPDDTDTSQDVFVRDLQTNTTTLVSRASGPTGEGGDGSSVDPAISPDGRFVAFDSVATNLVPDDTNNISDVIVRDLVGEYTIRASVASDGQQVFTGDVIKPSVSANASAVVFFSDGNFVPEDTNSFIDVMAHEADDDGDLILEPHDNCAEVANADQLNADGDSAGNECDSDDDGDSLPDATDGCPVLSEDIDGFQDGDGCPESDNDLDGILDSSDVGKSCFDAANVLPCHLASPSDCRNVSEDIDAFKDTDGCPEPDNDNDGFPDPTDACPGTDAGTGADGMFGPPQDLNHNGIRDGAEAAFTTDDVLTYQFEDRDGVLDTDGCHDSPGEDFDSDGYSDDVEAGVTLCGNALNDDNADDAVVNDGCPGGPPVAGSFSEGQARTGTDAGYPCGGASWPSDLDTQPFSFNELDIFDLTSFLAPTRRLDSSPPNVKYETRWDLRPGRETFAQWINIQDITALLGGGTGNPPMFGNTRAFGKVCPLAAQ